MKLATINEAAQMLGKSPQQLRRGITSGVYPFVLIGTRKLVDVDELTEIVKQETATISIKEAAALTGLSISTIRRGVRDGWVPCSKEGKCYKILPGRLLEALQGMKKTTR